MDEGIIPLEEGKFCFKFNAMDFGFQFSNYNKIQYRYGPAKDLPGLSDTVTITHFLEGENTEGKNIHSLKHPVIRGNRFDIIRIPDTV